MVKRTDRAKILIEQFIKKEKSGFVFVRGRRRIGKSTLLKEIESKYQAFYFSGAEDENDEKTRLRFVEAIELLYPTLTLSQLKKENLTWSKIFSEITKIAQAKKMIIILDEIQWMVKLQSGLIGLLKIAWIDWEKTNKIKVILCGSSNKFFYKNTGGDEQILRGLRTHSDIWLGPLHLNQFKKDLQLDWTEEELTFASFFIGGIPYYWNQLRTNNNNFLKTLNSAIFSAGSIFIDEVDEILRLEFNKTGQKSAKSIIQAIGANEISEATITKATRLPQSTVNDIIRKLIEYSLLFEAKNVNRNKLYYLKDPLLIAYGKILNKLKNKIRNNTHNEFLLGDILDREDSFYIKDFTGKSFENFIEALLSGDSFDLHLKKILELDNSSFTLSREVNSKYQIDLTVRDTDDRMTRLIECKWTHRPELIKEEILQFPKKEQTFLKDHHKNTKTNKYVITNCKLSKSLYEMAQKNNVTLIELKQIFQNF